MAARGNALRVAREIDKIARTLDTRYRPILRETAIKTRDQLKTQWPNPTNSGPQASGRPSQSTGLSSAGWRYRTDRLSVAIWDNVSYAQYVHFARLQTAQAANDARETFVKNFEALGREITARLTKELNGIR